jgi:SNF2 family DNA or RNA helicase
MTSSIETNLQVFTRLIDDTGLEHKDYQYEGVKWCLTNELRTDSPKGVRGGFIADEMGLGKTITMIGTIVTNPLPYTLIVVPPILIQQWQHQISTTMNIQPLIFHGNHKKKITFDIISKYSIVITSYGAITMNKRQLLSNDYTLLHLFNWNRIIFDESHHMRNANTQLHISAKLLKSDIRWLVSGTPVQNCKQDFYSLCSLIKLPTSFYSNKDNLREIAKSFILKRTKKQVGILIPDLKLQQTYIKWTNPTEKHISKQIHACLDFANIQTDDQHLYTQKIPPIVHMIRAKQSCIMAKLMKNSLHKYNLSIDNASIHESSKINFITQHIYQRKHNNTGKIVFCNYKLEIDLFHKQFTELGLSVAVIDGRVNKTHRDIILSRPYDVLILQIQTGCEGLNLQLFYSEIYFVTPHWNPSVEDQAIARCHRIGQTKPVYVFRFLMNTFDEKDTHLPTLNIETYTNGTQLNKRNIINSIMI